MLIHLANWHYLGEWFYFKDDPIISLFTECGVKSYYTHNPLHYTWIHRILSTTPYTTLLYTTLHHILEPLILSTYPRDSNIPLTGLTTTPSHLLQPHRTSYSPIAPPTAPSHLLQPHRTSYSPIAPPTAPSHLLQPHHTSYSPTNFTNLMRCLRCLLAAHMNKLYWSVNNRPSDQQVQLVDSRMGLNTETTRLYSLGYFYNRDNCSLYYSKLK